MAYNVDLAEIGKIRAAAFQILSNRLVFDIAAWQ
jgi:hypothetical protein